MKVYIGLGSNLGDREAMIRAALDAMHALPETELVRASSLYDTEAQGGPEQPNFLNAAAQLDSDLSARQLLWNLQLIERRLGRTRGERWGPRVIDLDLLLYDALVLDEPDLKIPHPDMTQRSFVLVPLIELEPLLVHPVTHETLVAHLSRLPSRPPVKRDTRLWNR